MNKSTADGWQNTPQSSAVSVDDVRRIRRQRRLAQSDQEYATVRERIKDLSGHLRSKPESDSRPLELTGKIIIGFGLVIAAVLATIGFIV